MSAPEKERAQCVARLVELMAQIDRLPPAERAHVRQELESPRPGTVFEGMAAEMNYLRRMAAGEVSDDEG